MRVSGLLRLLVFTFVLVTTLFFVRSYISFNMQTVRLPRWMGLVTKENQVAKTKCGLSKPCPANFFAFKISSGAANVVGPSMCFENHIIMSPVKNNVGRGLNIALVNGTTGLVLRHNSFDMYSGGMQGPCCFPTELGARARREASACSLASTLQGPEDGTASGSETSGRMTRDPKSVLQFLKEVPMGTLVLVASYDDPGTKMNDDIRKLLSDLGSSYAKELGFRDSWVFLGARELKSKSPFEEYLKNNPDTNKYEGWPELLELEGCVPKKVF